MCNADMGTLFGIKAFAVAILGGITSAWGVMLAGLLFGVAEALITATLGSGYTQIITFALVIAVAGPAAQRPVRPGGGEEGMKNPPIAVDAAIPAPRALSRLGSRLQLAAGWPCWRWPAGWR